MSDCRKCAEFDWCKENEDCGLFKPKSQTNADRIRAMSDEELAKAFHLEGCPKGKALSDCLIDLMREPCPKECEKCWLNWLKQEMQT